MLSIQDLANPKNTFGSKGHASHMRHVKLAWVAGLCEAACILANMFLEIVAKGREPSPASAANWEEESPPQLVLQTGRK